MRILVVSDGRRGIENQALGLAEAVSRAASAPCDITSHRLESHAFFSVLPSPFQRLIKPDFGLPTADLVIGCGRQAIAPLITLRRTQPKAVTCYVQHPRLNPSLFDIVVAPDHDGLSGPNVETMIGSPNRVTQDKITTEQKHHAHRLRQCPGPRAMIAIGGPSQTHSMGPDVQAVHMGAAQQLLDRGYSLLVTTSRRTPDPVQDDWNALAGRSDRVWLHTADSQTDNPYFAFLGASDIILVSEDSTNMLTEACVTGKPVIRLPMDGQPGKFKLLYDALSERCAVQRWNGTIPTQNYVPLRETDRLAQRILDRRITHL